MVAISLYRGNLHKVPDVPRKWLTPTPTISLKDFKILLHRRSKALARLQSTTSSPSSSPDSDHEQSPTQNQGKDSDDVFGSDPLPEADDPKELNAGDIPAGPKDAVGVSGHGKAGETEIDTNLGEKLVNSDDVIKVLWLIKPGGYDSGPCVC